MIKNINRSFFQYYIIWTVGGKSIQISSWELPRFGEVSGKPSLGEKAMAQRDTLRHIFGKRIRALRKERKLSQEKLALAAGCNTSYLGLVERGVRAASLRVIEKLARALRLRPIDLFDFSETIEYKSRRDALVEQFQGLVRDGTLHDLIAVSMDNIRDYRKKQATKTEPRT